MYPFCSPVKALRSNNVCITVLPMLQVDSVVDLAYERIRELVLAGDIAPGARLAQVELAERLGISRTPVREALRRLSRRGPRRLASQPRFLGRRAQPRRGAAPAEVRLLLEPGHRPAGRRAPHRASPGRAGARDRARGEGPHRQRGPRREPRVPLRARPRDRQRRARPHPRLAVVGRSRPAACSHAARPRSNGRAPTSPSTARSPAAVADRCGDDAARLMEAHVRAAVQHWEDKQR